MSLLAIEKELNAEVLRESKKTLSRFSEVEKRFAVSPNSREYKMAFNEVKRATAGTGSIVTMLRVNSNPADSYLYWVLAKRRSELGGSFIVWCFNSSLGGLNNGVYDLSCQGALSMLYSNYARR